jgi:septal ring factor EnvC (AmiA/AmiB activator)
MARNRKSQSAAIRFGPALKAFLLCSAIVICCIGYVWQKKQIDELGRELRRREARLQELREQNDKLKKQLAVLLSQRSLDQRVRELRLGLVLPQPAQVWRLPEPAADQPAPRAEPQYAAGQALNMAAQ